MEALTKFWDFITNLNYSGIPIAKIAIVFFILTVFQVFRQVIVLGIVRTFERLTSKTETDLDDQLVAIVKPALSWLVLIAGFWICKEVLAEELGQQLVPKIDKIINLIVVLIVGYVIYRSASILGQIIAQFVLSTESELDDLIKPLLPKLFQSTAIILIAIKVGEMFLGQSAAALAGLFGGAGLTLGLLFKDIVYDWFCTIIIYSDRLYREGDWALVSGVGFVEILSIGFRTTTLHIPDWGSIVKMPNSRMISGIVENWSQDPGDELRWGLVFNLKIDGISSQQTARILAALKELPPSIAGIVPKATVRFVKIENNARVLQFKVQVNDGNLYYDAEENINLAILEILEQEGIDFFHVRIETSPEKFKELENAMNN